MAVENKIDELLNAEELPTLANQPKKLDLKISAERLKDEREKRDPGAEKRHFTRVDVTDRKLELKFSNGMQFARQYIENISLGGLFVKTDSKFEMGDQVPLEFSIPRSGQGEVEGARNFRLTGKVCRVSENGVGLEFIEIPREVRTELESFIRSLLPEGSQPLTPRAKASSLEALEKLREDKRQTLQIRKKQGMEFALIAALLVCNAIVLHRFVHIEQIRAALKSNPSSVKLGEKEIPIENIRSIGFQDQKFVFHLSSGEEVNVSSDHSSLQQLPYRLQESLRLTRSIAPIKEERRSKTAPSLTNLR